MRIPVNLASEPFRRDRPMLVASSACAVVLARLLGVLVFLIVADGRGRRNAGGGRPAERELRKISAEQAKLDGTLRQPANAEVLQRSLLLNAADRAQVDQLDQDFSRSGKRDAVQRAA